MYLILIIWFFVIYQSFKIIDRMKIYAKYCNNYDSADTLYKQKIKKKEFESFLNVSTVGNSDSLKLMDSGRYLKFPFL